MLKQQEILELLNQNGIILEKNGDDVNFLMTKKYFDIKAEEVLKLLGSDDISYIEKSDVIYSGEYYDNREFYYPDVPTKFTIEAWSDFLENLTKEKRNSEYDYGTAFFKIKLYNRIIEVEIYEDMKIRVNEI